jgi:polyhydroxybutyrate depolymerase
MASGRFGPGLHELTIQSGGVDRHALVQVPAASGPRPVVLVIHGAGGSGAWARAETGWGDLADRAGFVAVFPDGAPVDPTRPPGFLKNPQVWNDGSTRVAGASVADDVGFLCDLLDELPRRVTVDERRVFATGFSNGAGMVFRLAAERSTRLAAIAPVAGHCWVADPRPERAVPTLYLVGTADPLVPLAGGPIRSPWGKDEVRPAVGETLTTWAAALGCPPGPVPVRDEGGVRVVRYGSELEAWFIEGLGHHWPGGRGRLKPRLFGRPSDRVNGTEVIGEFFRRREMGGWRPA